MNLSRVKWLSNCQETWEGIVWIHTSVWVLFLWELRLEKRKASECNLHTGGGGDRGDLEARSPIHAKRGFGWIARVTMIYQQNKQIDAKQVNTFRLCSWLMTSYCNNTHFPFFQYLNKSWPFLFVIHHPHWHRLKMIEVGSQCQHCQCYYCYSSC